jgi:gas vesicle protein
MKYLVGFLAGAFVGAVVALLLAPSSGSELRAELRSGAEAELDKFEAEWQMRLKEVNANVESMRDDLSSYVEQTRTADRNGS